MLALLFIIGIIVIVIALSNINTGVEDEVNFPYEDSDEGED